MGFYYRLFAKIDISSMNEVFFYFKSYTFFIQSWLWWMHFTFKCTQDKNISCLQQFKCIHKLFRSK